MGGRWSVTPVITKSSLLGMGSRRHFSRHVAWRRRSRREPTRRCIDGGGLGTSTRCRIFSWGRTKGSWGLLWSFSKSSFPMSLWTPRFGHECRRRWSTSSHRKKHSLFDKCSGGQSEPRFVDRPVSFDSSSRWADAGRRSIASWVCGAGFSLRRTPLTDTPDVIATAVTQQSGPRSVRASSTALHPASRRL